MATIMVIMVFLGKSRCPNRIVAVDPENPRKSGLSSPFPDDARIAVTPESFITRWQLAGGSEPANVQSFVGELAELLGEPPPNPAREDPLAQFAAS